MRQRPLSRLDAMRRKTRHVLLCEQLWKAVRWPVFLIMLWLLGSLIHIPQLLPDTLRGAIELLLAAYALVSIPQRLRAHPVITREQIDERLEADSHLPFHPLTTLGDQPALMGNVESNAAQYYLWQQHCERVTQSLKALRVSPPRFFPTRLAKTVLFTFTLLSMTALFHTGPYIITRLETAFLPWMDDDSSPLPHLQAWIDHPSYAPGAPVFLTLGQKAPLASLPEGSVLHLILTDISSRPYLSGVSHPQIHRLSATSWQARAQLVHNDTIRLRARGRTLAHWPITITADSIPSISWTEKPGIEKDSWRTRFPWQAEQNFGLATIGVELTAQGKTFYIPLPLKGTPQKASAITRLDLSENPLAGLKVQGRLKVRSVSGQEAYSVTKSFFIGKRPLHDTLARTLITLRQRMALSIDSTVETQRDLNLLTELSLPDDLRIPLCVLLAQLRDGYSQENLQDSLWFLALYAEDRSTDGPVIATYMAELRAAHQAVKIAIRNMTGHAPASTPEQEKLHQNLERLKNALNQRMALMFQKATQSGVVMPLPDGKMAPWNKLAEKIEEEAVQNHTEQALEHLQNMADMAEQMRQADDFDLQTLLQQMNAQREARAQREALHHLITEETKLLNHSQARFAAATKNSAENTTPQDISKMSTADLLRQLGIKVPQQEEDNVPPATPNEETLLSQADARQNDHSLQYALQKLSHILLHRGKSLTGKNYKGLEQAEKDMQSALDALSQRHDNDASQAEQKVLADLARAQKEMRDVQKNTQKNKQRKLGFIPPPQGKEGHNQGQSQNGQGNSQNSEQSADNPGQDPNDDAQDDMQDDESDKNGDTQQKNRDPLGRKMDDSAHSDAHIPNQDAHDQMRKIEKELRHRASDQTRPQHELDYLNRLLAPFKGGP